MNNPDTPLCPARIWQLMEEISEHAETAEGISGDRSVPLMPILPIACFDLRQR
jgi:hypothetical protein